MEACYKISVIVPVYQAQEYLEQCVNSILLQDYEQKEIWLVDDGSKDNSGKLCDRYAEKHQEIHVIHKENGGLVSAWKAGLTACDGDYVMFVDSDDWVEPNMLQEMSQYLTGSDGEIISSDYVIEREKGQPTVVLQKQAPGEYNREQIERDIIPNLLGWEQRRITISRCMKLISRPLMVRNMDFCDERIRMAEDVAAMLPALIDAKRLVVMDQKVYYHYRYVNASMVHLYDKGLFQNILLLRQVVLKIIQEKFQDDAKRLQEMKTRADQEMIHMLLLAVKNEARGNATGYRQNIRAICDHEQVQELVKNTEVEIHQKSNLLLYRCLKKPSWMNLSLLRLAMVVYYRL